VNRLRPDEAPLNDLIKHAMGYAEFSMKKLGRVPPTLFVQTPGGIAIYFPETMGNEKAKNNFANTSRLIAVAYGATATAMVLESWITRAKPGRELDASIPPSQSPDREECVVIQVECVGVSKTKILSIDRNAKGVFTGFGAVDNLDEAKGRFSEIMPQKPQTEENRKMAKQLLMMMGVVPEEMGFNPMWN
jgi:hypothetical protein